MGRLQNSNQLLLMIPSLEKLRSHDGPMILIGLSNGALWGSIIWGRSNRLCCCELGTSSVFYVLPCSSWGRLNMRIMPWRTTSIKSSNHFVNQGDHLRSNISTRTSVVHLSHSHLLSSTLTAATRWWNNWPAIKISLRPPCPHSLQPWTIMHVHETDSTSLWFHIFDTKSRGVLIDEKKWQGLFLV